MKEEPSGGIEPEHGDYGEVADGISNIPGELSVRSLEGKGRVTPANLWRIIRGELRASGKIEGIIAAGQDVVAFAPRTYRPRVLVGIGLALLAGTVAAGATAVVIYKNHNRHKQEK